MVRILRYTYMWLGCLELSCATEGRVTSLLIKCPRNTRIASSLFIYIIDFVLRFVILPCYSLNISFLSVQIAGSPILSFKRHIYPLKCSPCSWNISNKSQWMEELQENKFLCFRNKCEKYNIDILLTVWVMWLGGPMPRIKGSTIISALY